VKKDIMFVREVKMTYLDNPNPPESLRKAEKFMGPEIAATFVRSLLAGETQECFVVVCLNSQNKPIAYRIVTKGTVNCTLAHPREIFQTAIATLSAAIVVAHNHPTGTLEPSREDMELTRQLVESGKILGIPVHDHIIVTDDSYTSLMERGLL
jgi:DNA repair protein RadC